MGTNFYRTIKVTSKDKETLKELIDQDKLFVGDGSNCNHTDSVESYMTKLQEKIHICKRSEGWKMCFDHHWGRFYDLTRESITKFLSEPNTEIKDEYGRVYTVEGFWDMVGKWNSSRDDLWTFKTYNQWEKSRNPYWNGFKRIDDIQKVKETFGIETSENDFEADGLIFSVFTDFR